jgi:hypothetical protein
MGRDPILNSIWAPQNEPELRTGQVQVDLILISRRRLLFGVPSDDVSDAMGVADKLILILWSVPNRFHAVDVTVGHLNHESFRSDKRFLALNGEPDLPVLHDPPRAVVRMETPGRLRTGRHGDVVAMETGRGRWYSRFPNKELRT